MKDRTEQFLEKERSFTFESLVQILVGGIAVVMGLISLVVVVWTIIYVMWSALGDWMGVLLGWL